MIKYILLGTGIVCLLAGPWFMSLSTGDALVVNGVTLLLAGMFLGMVEE